MLDTPSPNHTVLITTRMTKGELDIGQVRTRIGRSDSTGLILVRLGDGLRAMSPTPDELLWSQAAIGNRRYSGYVTWTSRATCQILADFGPVKEEGLDALSLVLEKHGDCVRVVVDPAKEPSRALFVVFSFQGENTYVKWTVGQSRGESVMTIISFHISSS